MKLSVFDTVTFAHLDSIHQGTIVKINKSSVLISYIPNPEKSRQSGIYVESTIRKPIESILTHLPCNG